MIVSPHPLRALTIGKPLQLALLFTCILFCLYAPAQIPAQDAVQELEYDDSLLIEPGQLPTYDFLQLTEGEPIQFTERYLGSLDVLLDDQATSPVIFPDVPADAPLAYMQLPELIYLALQQNFDLINSERSIRIARSDTRSAQSDFIPFVDLVSGTRWSRTRDRNATYTEVIDRGEEEPPEIREVPTIRENDVWSTDVGVESGVELATGGSIRMDGRTQHTRTWMRDGGGTAQSRFWDSNAEIRFIQPLLRGGGFDVGMADLRRARIGEVNTVLNDQLRQRDVVLDVIETYFAILSAARQLEVSRGAIAIRLQTLFDARERYNVGRVDESEILRAELNYLRELQSAVDRRRRLDEERESMLLILGLPLDTPISFIDITPELAERGRVSLPGEQGAVEEMLSNRIELIQSDLNLALARINLALARNDVLPNLDFDAGYNRRDSAETYSEAVGFEDEGWDMGLGLRIPLINIRRREALRRSVLTLDQRETDRLSTERNLIRQALAARRNVISTEVQLVILRKSVEQSRKNLELITGRYEVGFEQVTEVRIAQDDLFSAESNYNITLLNYQTAIARLYVALGRPLL